jgi:hypothetical protein
MKTASIFLEGDKWHFRNAHDKSDKAHPWSIGYRSKIAALSACRDYKHWSHYIAPNGAPRTLRLIPLTYSDIASYVDRYIRSNNKVAEINQYPNTSYKFTVLGVAENDRLRAKDEMDDALFYADNIQLARVIKHYAILCPEIINKVKTLIEKS